MSEAYKKLIKTLRTLFEMDKADLDFGIYRILNQKRDEIGRFLDEDLLPQVKTAFADYAGGGKAELQAELEQAIEQAKQFGAPDPEQAPPVLAIKAKLASAVDISAVENDVYSHLHTFFSRYYDQGDFISQRRYKADTYAIPYEGEEVKLYWANHDQYYVKSSEHLRDYAFTVHDDDGRTVRIKLVEADTEKDNVKATADQERRFVLDAEQPLHLEGDELQIRFQYVPAGRKKQDALNAEAVATIFAQPGYDDWLNLLRKPAPTEANPKRTLLEKHLNDYTSRNTFDYFIHKDLGGFLRRELDFYIKSEVLHLDDINDSAFVITEAHLRKIKVLRAIASKIIRLLGQVEDFQKKLWLKRKFVVETNYCITIDRVPESLYEEIVACDAQWKEWLHWRLIDNSAAISPQGRKHVLSSHSFLSIDTRFFNKGFQQILLSSIANLDEETNGTVILSDNFHALNLLIRLLASRIKSVYFDPPYNKGADGFLYKDNFRHSSWIAMIEDRCRLLPRLLKVNGAVFASIDEIEQVNLRHCFDSIFGADERVEELIWAQDTVRNNAPLYSTNHEYVQVYARSKKAVENDKEVFRERKPGFLELQELIQSLRPSRPSATEIQEAIKTLYDEHRALIAAEAREKGQDLKEAKRNDSWKGTYPYKYAEYRDSAGRYLGEDRAGEQDANVWVFREVEPSMPSGKQAEDIGDPSSPNYRFYTPPHSITGRPCRHPKRGWAFPQHPIKRRPSFDGYVADNRIVFGQSEEKIPQLKYFIHEVSTNVSTSVMRVYADGDQELNALFGTTSVFSNPKPTALVEKLFGQTTTEDDIVLDHFAGSGTTAQATIALNRADGGNRRFFLVDFGQNVDRLIRPRLCKLAYSSLWESGKPKKENGQSLIVKYVRLESYEDTLNNLLVRARTKRQQDMLDENFALREDYMLGYWLDVETADSPSMLNVDQFEDPFNYKLNIATGSVGAFKPTVVDLVETFNYLIGLRVKHIDSIRGFKVVTGTNPQDESVLVIWRKVKEQDNAALEAFMDKQKYHPRGAEFDHIYVNGDHTLEDPHSKVKMTEIEFKRLMFDVQDV